jgi:hypothetical protein
MNTEDAWREYRREYKHGIDQGDKAIGREGRMFASEFARQHGINPQALRRRMRLAGYRREGNSNLVPVKDLRKFLK